MPNNNPLAAQLSICQIYDQTNFHQVKGIDNAFDFMELCLVTEAKAAFHWKLASIFKKFSFTKEFLGSNFLLPTYGMLQVGNEIFR